MNMENIINSQKFTLLSVFGRVGQIYIITPCIDPKTGRYPKHIRSVDSNGDMILSEEDKNMQSRNEIIFIPENKMIEIESGREFDLNKPMDRAIWEAIEHCPLIASNRLEKDKNGNYVIDGNAERYGVAELYVENSSLEAKRTVDAEKKVFDAKSYIFNDPRKDAGRRTMAKILGRDMSNASNEDVTEYLLKYAQRMPERIITLYTGDDLSLRILFINAREKKIIRIKDKMYVYGNEGQFILGASDDAVIHWMKEPNHAKIVEMIKDEVDPDMRKKSNTVARASDLEKNMDDDEVMSTIEDALKPKSNKK